MSPISRKLAFILASTDHGSLIVNRFDHHQADAAAGEYGVGYRLLETGGYEPEVRDITSQLLGARRRYFGDGVVAVDCGANIGVHTVAWAKHMTGWGSIIAIEAQERIFYALAGNIAINNCFNACAIHAAAGAKPGSIRIPTPNYLAPGSFGSLELRQSDRTEYIGQDIDYDDSSLVEIPMVTIDSLDLGRLDLLKIDVEGMELEVLDGAAHSITRLLPIIIIEHLKTPKDILAKILGAYGYQLHSLDMNFLAIHANDPVGKLIKYEDGRPNNT